MDIDIRRVREAEEALHALLGPQVSEVVQIVSQSDTKGYIVDLPEANTIDLTLEDIASLVARTSNYYVRMARFSGIAKAEATIAKGRFDRKFKRSRGSGSNVAQREAMAMEQCLDEHMAMTTAEAVADLAGQLEGAARVSSESARKLLDKARDMQIGQMRESHGSYPDNDYNTY